MEISHLQPNQPAAPVRAPHARVSCPSNRDDWDLPENHEMHETGDRLGPVVSPKKKHQL